MLNTTYINDMESPDKLDQWAAALVASGDYKVLRRLCVEAPNKPVHLEPEERCALIIDTETTGLSQVSDEVIEIGMLLLAYSPNGKSSRLLSSYSAFNEPSKEIPESITDLTGIDREMVCGHQFDVKAIGDFIKPAALIIAHNAKFDRPFCEKISPAFQDKPWACSATEVPWPKLGYEGTKLSYLINQAGYFHNGHRALDDCKAVYAILSNTPQDGTPPLRSLLHSAREVRAIVRLQGGYDARENLKVRGYRWKGVSSKFGPHWYNEISEHMVEAELEYLSSLTGKSVTSVVERQTAFDRYRPE